MLEVRDQVGKVGGGWAGCYDNDGCVSLQANECSKARWLGLTKKQKPNFYASFMRILTSNLLLSFPMGLSKALEDH